MHFVNNNPTLVRSVILYSLYKHTVLQFSIDVWVGVVVKYNLLCASTCGSALVFVFISIFEKKVIKMIIIAFSTRVHMISLAEGLVFLM